MILHFGGSSLGIKNHLDDYHALREHIIYQGHTLARDWLVLKKHHGLVNLFSENEKSISRSDGVILDATYDTHGVGIQLAIAFMYKRPILLLTKKGAKTPITQLKLVNDKDKRLLQSAEFSSASKADQILLDFTDWVDANNRLARFNIELDRKLDNYLKLKGRLNHTSKTEEIRRLVEEDFKQNYEDEAAT